MASPVTPSPLGSNPPNPHIFALTKREWAVLVQVANDFSNAEIADRISTSTKSVENYRSRIGEKLDLRGCKVLARFARRHATELRYWYQLIIGEPAPLDN